MPIGPLYVLAGFGEAASTLVATFPALVLALFVTVFPRFPCFGRDPTIRDPLPVVPLFAFFVAASPLFFRGFFGALVLPSVLRVLLEALLDALGVFFPVAAALERFGAGAFEALLVVFLGLMVRLVR